MQQYGHVIGAELDVILHHAKAMGPAHPESGQGVFGGKVAAAAMGDEARPWPAGGIGHVRIRNFWC